MYLIQEEMEQIANGVKGEWKEGQSNVDPKKLELVHTQQEKYKKTGSNWVGNKYQKKWVGYFLYPSKPADNTIHGKKFNTEIIFNTKKDMEKFLEINK